MSVSGEEKFKLFVIANGSAPTQLTFLADSTGSGDSSSKRIERNPSTIAIN